MPQLALRENDLLAPHLDNLRLEASFQKKALNASERHVKTGHDIAPSLMSLTSIARQNCAKVDTTLRTKKTIFGGEIEVVAFLGTHQSVVKTLLKAAATN